MTGTEKPRRSDTTRAAILSAARERFAADGYERATIRAIAADASIDPQVLGLALVRYVLRVPPIAGLTRDEVVAWLAPTIQRYLTGTAGN